MQARFLHDGKAIDFLSSADIPAGTVIVRDALVGITKLDVEANRLGALHVVGVFDVAKSAVAIPLGSKVYWDATAENACLTEKDNTLLGVAVQAAVADDAVVKVRIG
ncbi:MAG: DUF2190 family protein [Planctomycetaceae bacterium]|nr:DUF2190 family protein [Planctomycetaceae bacterium]